MPSDVDEMRQTAAILPVTFNLLFLLSVLSQLLTRKKPSYPTPSNNAVNTGTPRNRDNDNE